MCALVEKINGITTAKFEEFKYNLEKSNNIELIVQKTNSPQSDKSPVKIKTVYWCSRNGNKSASGKGKKTDLSSCPCRKCTVQIFWSLNSGINIPTPRT